jgi:dTDP-4-dehydrorhamnose 3,5-epimerase-like enzyme
MASTPHFINGNVFTDERGTLSSVNGFDLQKVRRLYLIEPLTNVVRAWQGHKVEQKWLYVVAGSFKFVIIEPDNWETPVTAVSSFEYTLTALTGVLHIPGGYANGFKALAPNSKVIVFSDCSVEASAKDDYRFDKQLWFDWEKN